MITNTSKIINLLIFLALSAGIFAQNRGVCVSGDCANGFGYYRWTTGDYYMGNFVNYQPQGYGALYYQNGKKYIGYFEKSKFNGEGMIFYPNGESRKGFWKNNELLTLQRNPHYELKANIRDAEIIYKQILTDRPAMQALAPNPSDEIYQFVIQKIAGEDILNLIYWQKESDENFPVPRGVNAAHRFPSPTQTAAIWIQNGISSEQMWSGLIFELFNIQNYLDFQLINNDAQLNKCDKTEFIFRYARLEHKAILKLQQFYTQKWLPYCQKKGFKSDRSCWYAGVSADFNSWISLYTDKKGYPYYPYGDFYDNIIKHNLQRY